jgi:hypothetical protein
VIQNVPSLAAILVLGGERNGIAVQGVSAKRRDSSVVKSEGLGLSAAIFVCVDGLLQAVQHGTQFRQRLLQFGGGCG